QRWSRCVRLAKEFLAQAWMALSCPPKHDRRSRLDRDDSGLRGAVEAANALGGLGADHLTDLVAPVFGYRLTPDEQPETQGSEANASLRGPSQNVTDYPGRSVDDGLTKAGSQLAQDVK